jgi:cytochrome b561
MSANTGARFTLLSRLLHWSMAVMVIAQLLIGVTMVASLSYYPFFLAIHRLLGVAILVFAVVPLVNRLTRHPPPFLATMGPLERRVATWSERLLYVLLLAQPLVG